MKAGANRTPDACPRCGEARRDEGIGGLCPKCFAQNALDADAGWLAAPDAAAAAGGDDVWPSLAGWRVTGVLGAGGMGRVYRAESEADGTAGALKVLDGRWSRDPLMAARFEAEALALKKLEHPNIVRVLDTGETDDGRSCLVMEFVDGCDLGRLLRGEKLTPERATDIFQKVCAAVACAHGKGFVHRDIKPANILAARDGTVKLVDFGLAKNIQGEGGDGPAIGSFTATTDHFGTAYYLAPERMLRMQAGPEADVYALGVLLYHLLAGQMPIGKYTPLSQAAGLPGAFDEIVGHALEADPAKRTASVRALADAVAKAWRAHQSGAERGARRRRLVSVVAFLSLVFVAAVAGAFWQRAHARPPAPPMFRAPATAAREKPWENSLGMKFVPVAGTRVLFSIWETRRRDAEPYLQAERDLRGSTWWAEEAKDISRTPANTGYMLDVGGQLIPGATWKDPGFPVTGDHPACFVTGREAERYCLWLTWKEQNEGRLKAGQHYRLPTTAEWLAACGGASAPVRPGNRAGPEARDERWPAHWPTSDERDDFPRLSPVGSFPAEPHGLHDISGNVSEWVAEPDRDLGDVWINGRFTLRGPAFNDGGPKKSSFAFVRPVGDKQRLPNIGFRVVLELEGEAK